MANAKWTGTRSESSYTERLEIFYKINQAVTSSRDPKIIAQTALDYIQQLLPATNRVSVSVFDNDKQEALLVAVNSDNLTRITEGTSLPLESYAPISFLQDGHVYVIHDFSQEKQLSNFKRRLTQEGIQSMMLAPLLAQGSLLGAINLGSTQTHVFTPEHVAIIQEIASSVAIALQQAKLQKQIEARMAAAEALAEVSAVLRAAHTIDEVLTHILAGVTAVIGGTSGSIFLLESDTNELVARGTYPPDPHIQTRRRQLGEGITGRVAATGRMFISEDLQQETMAHLIMNEIDNMQAIRSCVALPLRTQKHIVGVLHVGLPQKHTFTQTEIQLLTTISEIAGTALDRAMVLDTLEQRVARRTSALEQANERLKELDRLKSKFVSDVSHELRTPVTNLKLYLDLLHRAGPEKRERYHTILQQQTDRLIHLIESILDLSRLELGKAKIQFAPTDLNALIQQVTAVHQTVAEAKGLALTDELHPSLPLIYGERNQIAQVITNLLSNAINYTDTGQIQVQTHWDELTDHVCLTVTDTGIGINPTDKEHLFDRFYRGEHTASSDIPGNGLGLAIVKEIVDLHNGRIDIHSKIGQGSTFQVWLPCTE